jgi:uncharacterized protein YdaU (DUF1376 family)
MTAKAPSFQFYPKDYLEFKVLRMSDAAQGIYVRLLCHIWVGTKTQYKIKNDDRFLAKCLGVSVLKWRKYKQEIQHPDAPLFIEQDGYLISKRLREEREKQEERRKQTQKASHIRWGIIDNQADMQTHNQTDMQKASPSSSTSSSTSSHTDDSAKKKPKCVRRRKKTIKDMAIKKGNAPTNQMIAVFVEEFTNCHEDKPKIEAGKDGEICRQLWFECVANRPADPLALWRERCRSLVREFDIYSIGGIRWHWNKAIPKKKEKTAYDVMRERAQEERKRDKALQKQIEKERKEQP